MVGHREVPGRPALYATTRAFLDDLALRSLDELPVLDDLGTLVDANGNETSQLPELVVTENGSPDEGSSPREP